MSTSVFGLRARLKNVCAQTPYRRKRVRGRNAESCILVSVRDRFKRQNKTKSDKKPGDQRGRSHPRRETRPAPPSNFPLLSPAGAARSAQRPVILNDRHQPVEPITSGFFYSVFYHPHIPRTKAK